VYNLKKKILVWLDDELARFGIVKSIADQNDFEIYAIIDVTEKAKNFFETQTLVNFKQKWYIHDEIDMSKKPDLTYLKNFEKEYKINLWSLANNERVFNKFNNFYRFSHDEILQILEHECKLFEKIINFVKPDCIFLQIPFHHHIQLFFHLCNKQVIKTLFLRNSSHNTSKSFFAEHHELLGKSFEEIINKSHTKELKIEESNYNKRIKELSKIVLSSKKRFFSAGIKYFLFSSVQSKYNYRYFGRSKLKILKNSFFVSLRTWYRKKYIDSKLLKNINLEEPFIYFPLQIEQEHVLSTLAPYHNNQISLIENIAQSLPMGYKLYVKEHPTMYVRDWRSTRDYETLFNLPNVKLLHPSFSSKDLLKNTDLVITISGTSALEAGYYNKPSIMLADRYFSKFPFIVRINLLDELPKTIIKILSTEHNYDSIKNYIDYINSISFPVDYHRLTLKSLDAFHYGGFLVDTNIDINTMNEFLIDNKPEFDFIANEFIKNM
tara:strand:- start:398 stop:1876 length:1479 start_codon:yes stop_codon:yes gene_type:complete